MIDWEMKARQLAENLQATAFVLGAVAIAGLLTAKDGWSVCGWLLVMWCAADAFADARIAP